MNRNWLPQNLHQVAQVRAADFTPCSPVPMLIYAGIAFLAGIGEASATCTGVNTAVVTCTSPPADSSFIVSSVPSGSMAVTASNWVLLDGSLQIEVNSPGAEAIFNGDNVNATNNGLSPSNGVIHVISRGLGGNVALTIANSRIQQNATTHGLGVHAVNATGTATLTMTNTNVVNTALPSEWGLRPEPMAPAPLQSP